MAGEFAALRKPSLRLVRALSLYSGQRRGDVVGFRRQLSKKVR
jgi:hypothetical protein